MTRTVLRNKIAKRLEELDKAQLESAYLFIKELGNQEKLNGLAFDKTATDEKIKRGLQQLNNGEGTDFGLFLNEMKARYGKAE